MVTITIYTYFVSFMPSSKEEDILKEIKHLLYDLYGHVLAQEVQEIYKYCTPPSFTLLYINFVMDCGSWDVTRRRTIAMLNWETQII